MYPFRCPLHIVEVVRCGEFAPRFFVGGGDWLLSCPSVGGAGEAPTINVGTKPTSLLIFRTSVVAFSRAIFSTRAQVYYLIASLPCMEEQG